MFAGEHLVMTPGYRSLKTKSPRKRAFDEGGGEKVKAREFRWGLAIRYPCSCSTLSRVSLISFGMNGLSISARAPAL